MAALAKGCPLAFFTKHRPSFTNRSKGAERTPAARISANDCGVTSCGIRRPFVRAVGTDLALRISVPATAPCDGPTGFPQPRPVGLPSPSPSNSRPPDPSTKPPASPAGGSFLFLSRKTPPPLRERILVWLPRLGKLRFGGFGSEKSTDGLGRSVGTLCGEDTSPLPQSA